MDKEPSLGDMKKLNDIYQKLINEKGYYIHYYMFLSLLSLSYHYYHCSYHSYHCSYHFSYHCY